VHARYRQTTDRRQTTDGRAIAYSEREREFTFANEALRASTVVTRKHQPTPLRNAKPDERRVSRAIG